MNIVQNSRISSILCAYFKPDSWEIVSSEGGVNNTTRQVIHDGKRYNLRIYENHQDPEKVEFEARVLSELQSRVLSFRVPKVILTQEGKHYARTADGKLGCLFEWIEGSRAVPNRPKQTEAVGAALAELVAALSTVAVEAAPAYEPYYDIYHIHPLVTRESLLHWLAEKENGSFGSEAQAIREEIRELEHELARIQQLPAQLVHSDAVYGNLLVDDKDQVSGILDFEFVTLELRAMELAVFMGELVKPEQEEELLWQELKACLSGYGRKGRLTKEELAVLPRLIKLRRLVLVLHFLGRHWAGVDSEEPIRYMSGFASVRAWFHKNGDRCKELIYQLIPEEQSSYEKAVQSNDEA